MTGAEYRTRRETVGLSLREAAEFHDVRESTINHWQEIGPPDGAARELAHLNAQIQNAVDAAIEQFERTQNEADRSVVGVDLVRFRKRDYPRSRQHAEGLPHGAHNRLIALTAERLAERGAQVRIEYADPEGS